MSDGPQEAPAGAQRVAVVTGGARGIGAGTAQRLASDGLAVAVLDLKEGDCGATVDAITAAGGRVHWARTAAEARGAILDICRAANAKIVVT